MDVAPSAAGTSTPRNVAIDAYRGFVMLLMMAEVLRFRRWPNLFQKAGSGKS